MSEGYQRDRFGFDLKALREEGISRTDIIYSFLLGKDLLEEFSNFVRVIVEEDEN